MTNNVDVLFEMVRDRGEQVCESIRAEREVNEALGRDTNRSFRWVLSAAVGAVLALVLRILRAPNA